MDVIIHLHTARNNLLQEKLLNTEINLLFVCFFTRSELPWLIQNSLEQELYEQHPTEAN